MESGSLQNLSAIDKELSKKDKLDQKDLVLLMNWCEKNLPHLSWSMILLKYLKKIRENQNDLNLADLMKPRETTSLVKENYQFVKQGIEELVEENYDTTIN